jgi:RHS repeat-associated protein
MKGINSYYHLSGASMITNSTGNFYQALAYCPFGETLINERVGTTYDEMYKFTGYERDQESGLDYANARYYNSDLGIMITTDPMWAKYPSLTSYNYCGNNPVMLIDPDGSDWIVPEGTTNYQWRDDIDAESTMPEGYQYVGTNDADIIAHLGMNYDFPELSSNDIGMVASDAELGRYAVSQLVNVREKSNATISANVTCNKKNETDNNMLGRTFNGISIKVTNVSSNSGVDGDLISGGRVNVQFGAKNYQSALKEPEGTYFRQTGTTISTATVNIPKSALSGGSHFSQIQVTGNWFVKKPEGITPIVRHALTPYPISFKHTWTFTH